MVGVLVIYLFFFMINGSLGFLLYKAKEILQNYELILFNLLSFCVNLTLSE